MNIANFWQETPRQQQMLKIDLEHAEFLATLEARDAAALRRCSHTPECELVDAEQCYEERVASDNPRIRITQTERRDRWCHCPCHEEDDE